MFVLSLPQHQNAFLCALICYLKKMWKFINLTYLTLFWKSHYVWECHLLSVCDAHQVPKIEKKIVGVFFLNYFILNLFICLSLSHSKEFMGTHRPLYQVQVLGWTHIYTHCSQQCLFCCGANSARCWTRSSESLYHIDRIVSHSCCRFIGCTSIITSLNYIPKEL